MVVKKTILKFLVLALIVFPMLQTGMTDTMDKSCLPFSDSFDSFDLNKWADVLLLSESQGNVFSKNGRLVLEAPGFRPCEILVYSLFTFGGDFDIQVDYDLTGNPVENFYKFNTGIVMQTLMDEKSYKVYASQIPGKKLYFKARADREGEKLIEKHKGESLDQNGRFRVVRKDGILSAFTTVGKEWLLLYQFKTPCNERLRLRFKLQTEPMDETGLRSFPALIEFDNFIINSCTNITIE